jgi:hypothetical protein
MKISGVEPMTRSLWAAICCTVLATSQAMAQSNPVFTEKTVHPFYPPVMDAPRDVKATPAPALRPVARGNTPRSHAQELAEVFRQACLQGRGQMSVASDWALTRGFTPLDGDAMKAMVEKGGAGKGTQLVNVFARHLDDGDSLMVMLADHPQACLVGTHQAVDGQRPRERMAQFAAAWAGQAEAPVPVVSMDTNGAAMRTVMYKMASGQYHESLLIMAPVAVGSGLTLLGLSIDDAPSPVR